MYLPYLVCSASLLSLACAGNPQTARAASPNSGMALMPPKDLCQSPEQAAIRRRIRSAKYHDAASSAGEQINEGLVPCKHGRLRYASFAIAKQQILVVVEEDFRPSYISGGTTKRSLGLVDKLLVEDFDMLWKLIPHKNRLSDADIGKLLVAATMFMSYPTMVMNKKQQQDALNRWPAAAKALQLAPPGLKSNGLLQVWIIHGYTERGVDCQYLEGWSLKLDRQKGLMDQRNHNYASGSNMGDPCGDPLPGSAGKP